MVSIWIVLKIKLDGTYMIVGDPEVGPLKDVCMYVCMYKM